VAIDLLIPGFFVTVIFAAMSFIGARRFLGRKPEYEE